MATKQIYMDTNTTIILRQNCDHILENHMHLGTLANFVFYSYNEALNGYLPCVKIL